MTSKPTWLYYLFAIAMLCVAAYSAVLLLASVRQRRRAGRDVEASHVVMGVAMAGMFVAHLSFGPSTAWELVFAAFFVWFVVQCTRSMLAFGPHLPHTAVHALMAVAMLLMYWFPMASTSSSGAMSMGASASSTPGGSVDPGLAFVLAFALFASAIFTLASPVKGKVIYGSHENGGAGPRHTGPCSAACGMNEQASGLLGTVSKPALVDLTHVVMSVGMGFMLVLML